MATTEDFRHFMECVVSLEDMQKRSGQSLAEFHQNLELFRRAPVSETSAVMAKVVASAPSARLTRYLKAGCSHEDSARLVASKLDSSIKGLRAHINQARVVLLELESLVKKTDKMMQLEFCSQGEIGAAEISIAPCDRDTEDEANPKVDEARSPRKSTRQENHMQMMFLILSMLNDDFKMQEKIVDALSLDSSSDSLQGYSLMWTLRPFVEDVIVDQALTWIRNDVRE